MITGAALVAFLGWTLLLRATGSLPPVSWPAAVLLACLAALVLAGGRGIRAHLRGTSRRAMDPIGAYRLVLLAQASALTGALVVGAYAGYVAVAMPDLDAPSVLGRALAASAMIIAGVMLCASGMWVQSVARIDPPDDGPEGGEA